MEKRHKDILFKHWGYFRENLRPLKILPKLGNFLAGEDIELLRSKNTTTEQVDTLVVDLLPRYGPQAFETFVRAIEATPEQSFIAKPLLKDSGMAPKEQEASGSSDPLTSPSEKHTPCQEQQKKEASESTDPPTEGLENLTLRQNEQYAMTALSESSIRDITRIIPPNDWKHVLKSLGLSASQIIHIDNDERSSDEKIFQGLLKWYEGGEASLTKLTDTLKKIDPCIADKLKDGRIYFKQGKPNTPHADRTVTESLCNTVSSLVSEEWKWFLRYLFIQEKVIRNAELDARPNTTKEKCLFALREWLHECGADARYSAILLALEAAGKAKTARELEKLLRKNS